MPQQDDPLLHTGQHELDTDSRRLSLKEAVTFIHRGMDDETIERLTGIDGGMAWEAAIGRGLRPMPFLPTPAEIAARALAVRLVRPRMLAAAVMDCETEDEEHWEGSEAQWP